jgi:C_GCAxxG_C_C family probable redox protein
VSKPGAFPCSKKMDSLRAMSHANEAVDFFMQGYNCAQSTSAAFARDFGLRPKTLLTMTAGLGGGMGGLRGTCGAVSAMALVASLHAGTYAPEDVPAKRALYALVRRMNAKFKKKHGTTCCAELLARASCSPRRDPSPRTAGYYAKRPCARFVASAARIAERCCLRPVAAKRVSTQTSSTPP